MVFKTSFNFSKMGSGELFVIPILDIPTFTFSFSDKIVRKRRDFFYLLKRFDYYISSVP